MRVLFTGGRAQRNANATVTRLLFVTEHKEPALGAGLADLGREAGGVWRGCVGVNPQGRVRERSGVIARIGAGHAVLSVAGPPAAAVADRHMLGLARDQGLNLQKSHVGDN